MKQQLSLSYGWRENRGGGEEGLAECLSFCQVLLGPPHNKEMDWKVEKEDREASMIYCLQGGHCIQLLWQLIYQRKPNILHHLHWDILQIHITSSVVLWLNKSIKNSYVPRQVCVTMCTHSNTASNKGLESIKASKLQLPFKGGKMHYSTSVLWNEHKAILYTVYYSLHPSAWLCTCVLFSLTHYEIYYVDVEKLIRNQQWKLFLPWQGSDSKCFSNTLMLWYK